MSVHVALRHVTRYRYDRPVALGPQVVRLRPAPHCRTRVVAYSLGVTPDEHFINWQQDPQSNYLARLVFPKKTREFVVDVDLVAELAVINPFDFFLEPSAERFPFGYEPALRAELAPYLAAGPLTPRFERYLRGVPRERERSVAFLFELNKRLAGEVEYVIRHEPGVQTPEETLTKGSGSCRDSGWLLVQLLRHLGLAARFVSGYLIQLAADAPSLDGPSGPSADFADLHAWAEVYLPGAGWVGLDPTSGLLAGEGHLPLACSPEPGSAAPITGSLDECEVDFSHEMTVVRAREAPRVTKPYTEEQWRAIEALGDAVDADLARGDVRLTMGGEPTFVSVDDPDGAEWNTAALGPTKRTLAAALYHRARRRYGPKGLVHFGQGKWYPGEQLPRWSLNCFWRVDGEPIWQNDALVADEANPSGATEATAAAFLRAVAGRLGLDPRHAFAAYEDVFYHLWRERRLPANVDPFDAKLDDPLERERLMRVFTRGLDRPVGHVLPVARGRGGRGWVTGPWFLRSERCYLVPGDSPLGYRLPLDSQPWASEADRAPIYPQDPWAPRAPLAPPAELRRQRPGPPGGASERALGGPEAGGAGERALGGPEAGGAGAERAGRGVAGAGQGGRASARGAGWAEPDVDRAPGPGESAAWVTRTAMCAEARGGVLYVFMPPVERLEDYLELVAAIEATAEAMGQPVLLEGYEPPRDARLAQFRVTPDPGVVEVNVHPASGWRELVERTTFLYEAARASRLAGEKFLLDGRHAGTGGGNHFVLGGATPADSPWLRRPDLLRSVVSYWHQHPSLSYLFSGLFIGPTSQAPRVDEARHDSVYELEIAFRQMGRRAAGPGGEGACPPWLVDRLLRNLLVDVTGNTHRAEFCIDKLYAPEGAAGRLGLLELRAFEMPPHARMSLAQQLLLRALVARFWREPFAPARLVRWGTELHDRFLLPHFVGQDFGDVLGELREAGYPFDDAWFAPHFEFRFPKYGDYAARGVELELRGALEPWPVLGEEGAPGGTARYVDSSVERLQVKATGLSPDRYAVTVNGEPLPLRPTGRAGEAVAGVRYRAWRPPSALHPTIGVHAPLTFDLVDLWTGRSLGGCEYHVAHPGGRSYDAFPVNAFEAEGRRLSRFFRLGHTPGRLEPGAPRAPAEFPFTLDLRSL
ncbi:MAG TPA: transglutaminase family protein [Polyangiaceae bacterium]|nr:transglutaminase family protein [Polyangiaceae bacterium]